MTTAGDSLRFIQAFMLFPGVYLAVRIGHTANPCTNTLPGLIVQVAHGIILHHLRRDVELLPYAATRGRRRSFNRSS
jgi:hypothetical protein